MLISALRVENDRLARLLGVIDGGRWWTTDHPDRLEIDALIEQAVTIRAAIDFIEEQVGHLGGR